jgi:small-conductance mechanosensitive channel
MSAGQRLRSFIEAIIGTLVAMVLILVLFRISRLALKWMQSKSEVHRQRLRLGDMDLMDKLSILLSWVAKLLTQIGALAVVTLWVIFVLNRFPETQRWGFAARSSLIDILQTFEKGLLRAIPGILAVILIIVVARFVSRIVGDIFSGVERGSIRFPGVHPETAGATRRLVNVLIWMFAIVVAYPLIPGSDSAAFQGVSVFLGLIVTLGSSGIVGHMMSGLVVVYSRALQKGDYIRVGDIEGIVSEVGTLSIKVANAKKEEFTIPNTVIVGNIVKNYSRLTREAGIPVTTSVTIGYDAPWRVVQEMLVAAAERTPGVYKSPAPIVLQTKLSEFFVEYQLIVRLEPPALPIATLNLLHQNIQDIFNERGVQIMVPAFESQPERPIVIPKSKWNQAPGDRQA